MTAVLFSVSVLSLIAQYMYRCRSFIFFSVFSALAIPSLFSSEIPITFFSLEESPTPRSATMVSQVDLIESQEGFRKFFCSSLSAGDGCVQLLLCIDGTDGAIPMAEAEALLATLRGRLGEAAARLTQLGVWPCTGYPAVRTLLDKQDTEPLLLVVAGGAVVDRLPCQPLSSLGSLLHEEAIRCFCERLVAMEHGVHHAVTTTETPAGEAALQVNVRQMIEVGCRTLQSGKAVYASKIFVKAVRTLDAMQAEILASPTTSFADQADYYASLAVSLAWAGMAEMIMGGGVPNLWLDRLRTHPMLRPWRDTPLSDVARALTLERLLSELGPAGTWQGEGGADGNNCSQKHLRDQLAKNPHDTLTRRRLLVTLFLAGDLERCLTESLKLCSEGDLFGQHALGCVTTFCGPDHPLIKLLAPA